MSTLQLSRSGAKLTQMYGNTATKSLRKRPQNPVLHYKDLVSKLLYLNSKWTTSAD